MQANAGARPTSAQMEAFGDVPIILSDISTSSSVTTLPTEDTYDRTVTAATLDASTVIAAMTMPTIRDGDEELDDDDLHREPEGINWVDRRSAEQDEEWAHLHYDEPGEWQVCVYYVQDQPITPPPTTTNKPVPPTTIRPPTKAKIPPMIKSAARHAL